MERERGFKIIAIIALVIAVAGVSIGFAAFSKDLTINVAGTVTPEDLFTIQFSDATGAITTGAISTATGTTSGVTGSATITGGSIISNVTANFKKPGDTAVFKFYVTNTSAYTAYLKSITLSATEASCAASGEADISTVTNGAAACADMSLSVNVGGSTAGFGAETSISDSNSIAAKNGSTYSSMLVTLTLTYGGSSYVDGGITVDFGSILLGYSTAQ